MSKIVQVKVSVRCRPDGVPRAFWYRGLRRVEEILDSWREVGEWWDGEIPRTLYRVQADDGGVYELERRDDGCWLLYKVYD